MREVVDEIECTLPLMRKHAREIAMELYRNIFRVAPSVKTMFSLEFLEPKGSCPLQHADKQLSAQAQLLSDSIVQFAVEVARGDLSNFEHALARICAKHVSRGVEPAHFSVVVDAFARAARTCVGKVLTEKQLKAWRVAVQTLADELVMREQALADRIAREPGSWRGFRAFTVAPATEAGVADDVARLSPLDCQPLAEYMSGQFVCMRVRTCGFGDVHLNTPLVARRPIAPSLISDNSPLRQYVVSLPVKHSSSNQSNLTPDVISSGEIIARHVTPGALVDVSPPVGGFMLTKMTTSRSHQSPLTMHCINRRDAGGLQTGRVARPLPFAASRVMQIINDSKPTRGGPRSPMQEIMNRRGIDSKEVYRYMG